MKNKGFIGLGVMGSPMAGHISKAGYDVTVSTVLLKNPNFGMKSMEVKLPFLPLN